MDYGDFSLFLSRKGLKPSTIRTHVYALRRILEVTGSDSLTSINTFLLESSEKGLSGKYLNHLIIALRLYGQMKLREDLQKTPFYKEKEYIKSVMNDEEIKAFLELPPPKNGNKDKWWRWTLFFSIMAFTGMRPNEVAHLTVDTVDLGQNVLVLGDTKTNDPRLVPIAEVLKDSLKKRVDEVEEGFLFPSIRGGDSGYGKVVDNVDWHYNFHTRIKKLGIKRKNLTPYSLRHSWITTMLSDDSVKLFDVKRVVGHKQTSTTEHYYAYTMKNLKRTVNKHPLARNSVDPKTILKSLRELLSTYGFEEDPRFAYEYVETEEGLSLDLRVK